MLFGCEFSDPRLHESIHLATCTASEEEMCIHDEVSKFLRSSTAYYEMVFHDAAIIEGMRSRENKTSEIFMDDSMRKDSCD